MRDIVYILGSGSKWENNELRYSLRSLQQFGRAYGKVYIVGEKPSFISDEVIHIKCADPFTNKQRNICHKISTASRYYGISDNFILMNDDIFLLHSYIFEEIYYWSCTLRQLFTNAKGNNYSKHIRATIKLYPELNERCFDMHYPFVINKKGYLAANKGINWEVDKGYLTKTVYMKYMIANNLIEESKIVKQSDCLIYRSNQLFPNPDVISVSTKGLTDKVKQFLITSFPNKSRFEI